MLYLGVPCSHQLIFLQQFYRVFCVLRLGALSQITRGLLISLDVLTTSKRDVEVQLNKKRATWRLMKYTPPFSSLQ